MALTLLRDRAALTMIFVLPSLLFLLVATTVSGSNMETRPLRVVVARLTQAPAASTVLDALASLSDTSLTLLAGEEAEARIYALVQAGGADVGLLVRGDPTTATAAAPFVVISSVDHPGAGAILAAGIQTLFATSLPGMSLSRDAAQIQTVVGPFSAEQDLRLKDALARAPELTTGGGAELVANQQVHPTATAPGVIYYAGAITFLFLLLTAMPGALSLEEEGRRGVLDRVLVTRGGIGTLLVAKFTFLTLQGLALSTVLFAVAQLVHGVDVIGHFPLWLAVSVAGSAAAAGVTLALAGLSLRRPRARTLTTFAVLLLAALGGAMAPRFLMPHWLRLLGDLTPTAWAIEAYQNLLWRNAPPEALLLPLAVLLAFALAGLLVTFQLLRRAARMA